MFVSLGKVLHDPYHSGVNEYLVWENNKKTNQNLALYLAHITSNEESFLLNDHQTNAY